MGMITDIPKGIECQVVELDSGDYMMSIRSAYEDPSYRKVAISNNSGDSWTPVEYDYELITPHCMASIMRYTSSWDYDTSMLLFSNPACADERIDLTVKVSYDEGNTWPVSRLVNENHSGYSCLTILKDNTIGCLYENGDLNYYDRISFVQFSYTWLAQKT
jgi:sialidase-1